MFVIILWNQWEQCDLDSLLDLHPGRLCTTCSEFTFDQRPELKLLTDSYVMLQAAQTPKPRYEFPFQTHLNDSVTLELHACFLNYSHHSKKNRSSTHRLAIPAFLTAVEMAFTAVQMELSRLVSSPVPWALLPSSRTNLVRVTTLVSKAPLSDILPSGVGPGPKASSEAGEHGPKVKQWTLEQGRGCAAPLTNQKCPLWQRGVGLITSVKVQSSEIASICFVSKRQWLVPDSIAAHSFWFEIMCLCGATTLDLVC